MTFKGFTKKDFKTMQIPGLEARMAGIQHDIQPKFKAVGEVLTTYLSAELGEEMFLHIARHQRRSVNPPESTWLAICHDKRGYKKHPHFQVGLFDNYLFIWLAFIYENEQSTKIANRFLKETKLFAHLPDSFAISPDHTAEKTYPVHNGELVPILERFRDVKKGEFLVGKIFLPDEDILTPGKTFLKEAESVLDELIPFYKASLQ
ncbi:YktB family protein [Listeria ivanovii]|uniref:UPF0637 protein JI642_00840 n=2 Tax=Listeria ivanovii TaxID=1638 RepID=A0ABS1G195_LISIV|nr:DUF1054 family protein [Listeria ivanovii]EFR97372.1 conserved hypothetical protein [Listeria ivanovii FSL F6-596]AIS59486.1 hypothetical protein JL58_05585 [Listeria ivanovii subsp. londoniensis]AIS62315.1 hypothetical protein JL53_06065 [Listeria ivanovii subsp. londoniensis]MBC2253861.1 DUF1054 family protein [Listeria ivanovii]MBK1960645.1 DUF1054 family protein [Listeria ivanovii subsp. londoniensis]